MPEPRVGFIKKGALPMAPLAWSIANLLPPLHAYYASYAPKRKARHQDLEKVRAQDRERLRRWRARNQDKARLQSAQATSRFRTKQPSP